jgi:outer membrane protein assembly factor BamD
MKWIKLSIMLYSLSSLFGCSLIGDTRDETKNWSLERLYSEAKGALDSGTYESAIKYYEQLEARDPFGKYAQQAQLEVIYAYYKFEEPDSAIVAADRFIKLYPRHSYVDYAYYLKGLVNFERNQGILARILPLDRSQRDQGAALQSFYDFADLVKQFPQSKYSEDAKQRMVYLRNILAEYELHVARFYLQRGAYIAAANRAKTVIQSYQQTPAVAEALVILAKAYKIMGLDDLSANALSVLKLNYPNNKGIKEIERVVVK